MKLVISMTVLLFAIGCGFLYVAYNVTDNLTSEHRCEITGAVFCTLGIGFMPLCGLVLWIYKKVKK